MERPNRVAAHPTVRPNGDSPGGVRGFVRATLTALFQRSYQVLNRARGLGRARSLVRHIAGLSPEGLAELSTAAQVAHRMDYERHDIYLLVTSEPEVKRLKSAAKEPWTVAWIEKYVRPGDVLYDIGANVGAYSLVAAKCTGGQARVYAFEPGCTSYASLCRNIILNGCQDSVIPLPVALSNRTGMVKFRYHSLLPGDALHAMGERAVAGKQAVDQPVLGIRLDDLTTWYGLPLPNHIKLDVDGAELDILHGAAQALVYAGLRTMMAELNEEDVDLEQLKRCLSDSGLHLATVTKRSDSRGPAYGLFVRQESAAAA